MEYMRKLPRIPVDKIFDDITYIVPIYQRNYAWESQIEQMLEDILTTPAEVNYYLGSLVINELPDHRAEVIDGQQRLTTLYLLFRALQLDFRKDALQFAARSKYTLTLKDLDNLDPLLGENAYADELIDGYRIIQNYLQEKHVQKTDLQKRLKHIFLIQIPVPKNIDLNHYFEIMNTRGEQLEPHEIAKGKILSVLNSSDQQAAARIWDACADMERYVQMNFPMGVRRQLFGENWSRLCTADFDQTAAYLNASASEAAVLDCAPGEKTPTLYQLLQAPQAPAPVQAAEQSQTAEQRFESLLSFQHFLLHAHAALLLASPNTAFSASAAQPTEQTERLLDDRYFFDNLKKNWSDEQQAKNFVFGLLRCRVLFDAYIVKREYESGFPQQSQWSLQQLIQRNNKPEYRSTWNDPVENTLVKTLESCLRVTYTSAKSMHWITLTLRFLLSTEPLGESSVPSAKGSLLQELEKYCCEKVKNAEFDKHSGFHIERIVFTYLDYLLFRDRNEPSIKKMAPANYSVPNNWSFQFRNSIEHFFPQHPDSSFQPWDNKTLNCFGNLALITVSGNSKFSNLPPKGKIEYPAVAAQSLKLLWMAAMTRESGCWTEAQALQHQTDMSRILNEEIKKQLAAAV